MPACLNRNNKALPLALNGRILCPGVREHLKSTPRFVTHLLHHRTTAISTERQTHNTADPKSEGCRGGVVPHDLCRSGCYRRRHDGAATLLAKDLGRPRRRGRLGVLPDGGLRVRDLRTSAPEGRPHPRTRRRSDHKIEIQRRAGRAHI